MPAEIIDGNFISQTILNELKEEVRILKSRYGKVPGLATILVGENPASVSYVTRKMKTAEALGFNERQINLPADVSEAELLVTISSLNTDDSIHGILVQLPLPGQINEKNVINSIAPEKDVDGFHPLNLGNMHLGGNAITFLPCTPAGIQELLIRSGVELDGAEVVVVGRSNIVGKPLSVMLAQKGAGANATVTVTHTGTKNLESHCKRADVLIVAAGVPGLVPPHWIKPGATVIDVGVNRIGVNPQTGKAILAGDVDFKEACGIAGKITPVPGGVGPMTIAMLMKNTVNSAKRFFGKEAAGE